jgi:nucleoid DNA-binding protein
MDKPISMSVKDYLIRMMSVKMMLSEKTIEAVVNHQFQSANVALQENNSLEISGFGKFYFNHKKAQKRMEKMLSKAELFTKQMNDEKLSEQRRNSAAVKLANTLAGIEVLKPKLQTNENQSVTDLRGVEEPSDPCVRYEGAD